MNIIFLDFDGVMVTSSYGYYLEKNGLVEGDAKGRPLFDPACVENLNHIIEATEADVVVTSDWKFIDKYDGLLKLWKERYMPGYLTDITPNTSKHRGDEIDAWLRECTTSCKYVIIDDLDESNFNSHHLSHLIKVNPVSGLDSQSTKRAISILGQTRKL